MALVNAETFIPVPFDKLSHNIGAGLIAAVFAPMVRKGGASGPLTAAMRYRETVDVTR